MEKSHEKIIVIGGGAAGMMAAGRAAQMGASVTLIERNKILGKKILISGKGRCNVTNAGEIEDLIASFPNNGKFLYGPFYTFTNQDLINFFQEHGVKLKVERGNRVFPVSDSSRDIVKALEKYMSQHQVKVLTNQRVKEILIDKDAKQVKGVLLEDGQEILAKRIIVATGGCSFPGTGSTGDGYSWAKKLGHNIKTIRPGLIPLETREPWVKSLQGLSLRNVNVAIKEKNGKVLTSLFGEMLFTHFGVSGPIILSMSKWAVDYWLKNQKDLILTIDFKPALSNEQLDLRLQREIEKHSKKIFRNSLNDLLPRKIIPIFIELSQIDPEKVMHQLTRKEREKLTSLLKNFELTIHKPRPIAEAIVTAGGVNVKEIDPQTMESKIIKGLFFAGEIIDIDGFTGGYNLQAAFSTGFVAGNNASLFN
jgi:predicted Rossmann fold flavoprotein